MSDENFSMADILMMEASFSNDFSQGQENRGLYEQLHPQGNLLADGHDNLGSLPPMNSTDLSLEMVRRDTQFGIFSAA